MENEYQNVSLTLDKGNSTVNKQTGTISIKIDQNLLKDAEIAFRKLIVPVSWQNITAARNNNSFSYIFNGVTFPVVIPNSTLDISEIQLYFEFVMRNNGHFLLDQAGNEVFFLNLSVNSAAYRILLTHGLIPAVLPPSWTDPNGIITGTAFSPQFVTNGGDFNLIIGALKNSTYPAIAPTTAGSLNFENTPQVNVISSINLSTNVLFSPIQLNSYIYSFTQTVPYGSVQIEEPSSLVFYKMIDQSYNEINVTLKDQFGNNLPIQDDDLTISFVIRIKK